MGTAADPAHRDDVLRADAGDPRDEGEPIREAPTPDRIFVGPVPEVAQAVATPKAGGSVVVPGRAGSANAP